jgi:large subunit ribosomal protein L13
MGTYAAKPSDINKEWLILDATDIPLGRLATRVANLLRGKHKPTYTPHIDTGDFVIVINAEKVRLTGNKLEKKQYYRHSGYIGGLKTIGYDKLMAEKPEFVIRKAVKGMLPHNRIGRAQLRKLKVYSGTEHKHEAQKPREIRIEEVK